MNNSLRGEIKKIQYWQGTDGDPDFPEDVYDSIPDEVIDQILNLIASKMPEKDLARSATNPDKESEFAQGWNAFRAEVKSILKGEDSQ
jgi:hypothetical protein